MKYISRFFWLFPLGTTMYLVWRILGLIFTFAPTIKQCCDNIVSYTLYPFDVTLEMYPGAFVAANIVWAIFASPFVLLTCLFGVIYGATVIGIPIAKHYFTLARLMLTPFGSLVYIET